MEKHKLNVLFVTVSSILVVIGFNMFLIPHMLLSGGVSGVSMLISYFTPLNQSILYFVLNLPLAIAGWFVLGRSFILYTLVSIGTTSLFLMVIPVFSVSSDALLSAVFGGIFVGVGSGIAFKAGGSTGGFDIVGAIIARYRDFPIGMIVIALNGLVVSAIGYMTTDWNLALYSAVCIYITGKLIDTIYVGNAKITLYIITCDPDAMVLALRELPPRGITRVKSTGAFSGTERDMLMMVTTKYEFAEVKHVIRKTDPDAFVNITETLEVMGHFRPLGKTEVEKKLAK